MRQARGITPKGKTTYRGEGDREEDGHEDDGETTTPTRDTRLHESEEEARIRAIVRRELQQMKAGREVETGRRQRRVPKPIVDENPAERLEIQVSSTPF